VDVLGVRLGERERSRGAGSDGQLGAGQGEEAPRVLGDRLERGVAGDGGQPQHAELRRGQRQREREQVVQPRVGVDVDALGSGGAGAFRPGHGAGSSA
jgi:hypothetical protein